MPIVARRRTDGGRRQRCLERHLDYLATLSRASTQTACAAGCSIRKQRAGGGGVRTCERAGDALRGAPRFRARHVHRKQHARGRHGTAAREQHANRAHAPPPDSLPSLLPEARTTHVGPVPPFLVDESPPIRSWTRRARRALLGHRRRARACQGSVDARSCSRSSNARRSRRIHRVARGPRIVSLPAHLARLRCRAAKPSNSARALKRWTPRGRVAILTDDSECARALQSRLLSRAGLPIPEAVGSGCYSSLW